MKTLLLSVIMLVQISVTIGQTNPKNFPVLKGPYLGQTPPGTKPEIFALDIVSTGLNELNSVFSPDGNEFYFCVRNMDFSTLFVMKCINGIWGGPETLPFISKYNDIDVSVSPDDQKLFFCSNRPVSGIGEPRKDYEIWYCNRVGNSWGEPIHLGEEVNSDREDFYPVVANNGTLYFNSQRTGQGTNDIYISKFIDGKYSKAEKLGPEINSEYREYDAYIEPDEKFLIFTSERPGNSGYGDLYISFKNEDGTWTEARNMGADINGQGPEFGTFISPDGKYLFYTRRDWEPTSTPKEPLTYNYYHRINNSPYNFSTNIWWVDAKFIRELRQPTSETTNTCTVTYIANEGFLLETKNSKILVDALFGGIKGNWCDQPSDSVSNLMLNGISPFNNIDVVLVTHKHRDHFKTSMVINFLQNNRKSVLICPDQVGEILKRNPDYSKVSDRIHSLQSEKVFDSTLIINRMNVRVLRFNHGSYFEKDSVTGKNYDLHADVENFGYQIEADGFTFFHSGDGSPSNKSQFEKYGFENSEFDIVFIDRTFLQKEGQELLNRVLHAKNIVFIHVEPGKGEYYRSFIKSVPEMFVFLKPMEKKIIIN